MIPVTLLLILQIIVAAGIGQWVLRNLFAQRYNQIEFNILIGLGIVGILGNVISLFSPLNAMVKGTIILAGLSAYINKSCTAPFKEYVNRVIRTGLVEKTILCSLVLIAILLAAGPIIRDDTESYHLQNILWLNEYGTIPGLANLHTRLGFNSGWQHTITLLTPLTKFNFYTTPNTLLSIVTASALLIQTEKTDTTVETKQRLISLSSILFMFSIWYYWRGNIQSCNYDYYFTAAAILVYNRLNQADTNRNYILAIVGLLPAILCSIRLIYFPSLIFTAYALYCWYKEKQHKPIAYTLLILTAALGAHLYRTYILTGYPLYPSDLLATYNAQWQLPQEHLTQVLNYIRNFSLSRNENILTSSISWITNLYLYEKVLVWVGGMGLIVNFIQRFIRQHRKRTIDGYMNDLGGLFMIIQISLWFYVSPEPRFISGLFFIGQTMLLNNILQRIPTDQYHIRKFHLFMGIFFLSFIALLISKKFTKEKEDYVNIYQPKMIPTPETRNFIWEKTLVRIPEKINNNWNARCYLTPLPCVYDSLPGIKMISRNIKDGFYAEQYKRRALP